MKKSRKILLYGVLSSILLITFCLYWHQDEFINELENTTSLDLDNKDLSIEQVLEEYKIDKSEESPRVQVNNTKIEEPKSVEVKLPIPVVKETVSVVEVNTTIVRAIKIENNNSLEDNKTLKDVEENISQMSKIEEVPKPISLTTLNVPLVNKGLAVENNNSVNEPIAQIQETISKLITSEPINFYRNRAKITNKGKQTLDKVVELIKSVPNIDIEVKGYTDASGKRKINQWISLQRAKSVKQYLESQGIVPTTVKALGFGEDGLLYANQPYSTLNRRVAIEIKRR